MFLKVTGIKGEWIYECKRIKVTPIQDDGAPEKEVVFDLEGETDKDFISLRLPTKQGYQAFVMSENGKTVDRYNLGSYGEGR